MKTLLDFLRIASLMFLGYAITTLAVYAVYVFVTLEWNIFEWTEYRRIALLAIGAMGYAILATIWLTAPVFDDPKGR